jgi:heptaprenyl diphosphate synthase
MIKQTVVEALDFDRSVIKVREELDKALLSAPKAVRSQTAHLSGTKGKMIRAISLLACAENNQGLIEPDAVRLAVSIELLHLATLVHDDVIDDAEMRRGMPTLHKKFGSHSAVISGDYLFCMALKTASCATQKNEYLDYDLPDYMGRVCLGELRQNMNNRNYDLSEYGYLKIIFGKTAALFEAAFYAGSMLCENEKKQANLCTRLGRFIGMIFQLSDDCIDYESSQDEALKPVLSDFEHGVVTLPLVYTFKKNTQLRERAKRGEVLKEEIHEAVRQAGGVPYTRSVSKKYYDKSKSIINRLNAHPDKKERLTAILNKAYNGLDGVGIG